MQPNRVDAGRDVLIPSYRTRSVSNDDLVAYLGAHGTVSLSAAERREVNLLRARLLLRQYRFGEVIALLGPMLASFSFSDESCTARMLHGIAVARSGQTERGLALLRELEAAARALEPHRAIRAEIAYWIAFVHWIRRDYAATLAHVGIAEAARAGIVSVRAASLRAHVAAAEGRQAEALALFRAAFDAYRTCPEQDEDLRRRIVLHVASLEAGLRCATIAGTHTLPAELTRIPDDAVRAPCVFRLQIAAMDGWLHALDGDKRSAYDRARVSEGFAPSDTWRVWTLANRALLAAAFGDDDVACMFARDALERVESVDWSVAADEERAGLLLLAEALARTEPAAAAGVLQRYDELTRQVDRALLRADDVRLWIAESWVRGLVHRIRGDESAAWQTFKEVYQNAQRAGLLWQAAQALIELDAIPLASRPRGEHYLQAAALIVREHFPHAFLARRLGRWARAHHDPVAAKLAPKPREVLRHFLAARSTKQIAALLGLSEHTVKDCAETLFRAFGVRSKEALLVACYERGIGSPAWWDTLCEPNPPPIAGERPARTPPSRPARRSPRRNARNGLA